MICSASDFSSSGLSACWSSPTSSPFTRTVAGRPTLSQQVGAVAPHHLRDGRLEVECRAGGGGLLSHWDPPGKGTCPNSTGCVFLHGDFADHTVQLRLDLVHDLHRFDDADTWPDETRLPTLTYGSAPGSGAE